MTIHPLAAAFPLLNAGEIAELSTLTESVKIKEGTFLLQDGHPADALYIITDGVVSVTKNLGDVEIVIADLAEGELIGEVSFASNFAATATVRASCDLEAIKIDKARLMTLLDDNAKLGTAVYRSIALTLSRRLMQMTERFAFQ